MNEHRLWDTCLRWKAFGQLLHILIPKQLSDLSANRVNTPNHVGSVRRNGLRILHPNTIFTCDVVGLPVSDRLTHRDQVSATCEQEGAKTQEREGDRDL